MTNDPILLALKAGGKIGKPFIDTGKWVLDNSVKCVQVGPGQCGQKAWNKTQNQVINQGKDIQSAIESTAQGIASVVQNDLKGIYGQDVRMAQRLLSTLQGTEVVTSAFAARQALNFVVKNAAKSAGKEAVKNVVQQAEKPKVTKVTKNPTLACAPGQACFVAGTLIQTIHGLKPIEQIQHGDLVWSRQEFGNQYAYQPVIATKMTANQPIYEVIVSNEQGETETYLTTAEHPFYVDGIGWLKASLLEAGMPLLDRNSNSGSLKVRSQTQLEQWDTVYNFEVQDYATYHIGKFGVWVHNECCKVATEFEHSLHRLPANERVAKIKEEVIEISRNLHIIKDARLSRLNNRDIYKTHDGKYLALDTQHGRWELLDSKGKHQGEVTLHTLTPIPNTKDISNGHNIRMK